MKKLFLVLIFTAAVAFGQARDRIVRDARTALSAKDYDRVISIHETFADTAAADNPVREFLTPIYIEALSFQKNYDEMIKLSVSYIAQFPTSAQTVRVYYLLGVAKANLRNFVQAIVALDEGLLRVTSRDRETERAMRNLLTRISAQHLSPEEREQALSSGLSDATIAILTANMPAAANVQEQRADAIKQDPRAGKKDMRINRNIGLLVPVTGEFSQLGETALNTVKMILAQHEEKTGEKFNLKIYDTEGNAVRTAHRVRELLSDSVSMIIGPIMSNTATVAAAVLAQYPDRAVMISPTATDDGIAGLSSNIFQTNVTSRSLAVKIADYAVNDLNIKSFTILAPLDEYGRAMTQYFTQAVSEMGAKVEYSEFFAPTASDFRRHFRALREHLMVQRFGETLNGRRREDFLSDSMITLGGLFLPVSRPDNAIQLAAQVPFHRLRAQILGVSVWGHEKVLTEGRQTVQGVCFSTAQRIDSENERVMNFVNAYRTKFKQEPNMLVAPLVADATNLMLSAFSQTNTVGELSRKLSRTSGYQGLSSEISFVNSSGENTGAVVMKISGQRAIRVK